MGSSCSLDMCGRSARMTALQDENGEDDSDVNYQPETPRKPLRSNTLAFSWEAPHR